MGLEKLPGDSQRNGEKSRSESESYEDVGTEPRDSEQVWRNLGKKHRSYEARRGREDLPRGSRDFRRLRRGERESPAGRVS